MLTKNKKPTTTWDAYNDNIRTKYTKKKGVFPDPGGELCHNWPIQQ